MVNEWHINPILERSLGSASVWMVVLLSAGLLLTWFVGFRWTATSLRRRAVISVLRLLTIVMIIVAMLRPTHTFIDKKLLPSSLVFLFDKSRSMGIEDALGGKSRYVVLQKMTKDLESKLAALGENVEVSAYAFDADASPLSFRDGKIALPQVPDGDQSDHGESMRTVLRREDGKRLIGFVLAGDGAQQTFDGNTAPAQVSARALRRLNCPLIAVSFGQHRSSRQAKDVILETMPDNLSVFVKNELNVTGTVRVSGYVGQDIPIQLLVEDKTGKPTVVATTTVRATRDNEQIRYQLSYIPPEAGEYQVAVRAAPQRSELTITNNQLPTFLTVREGGLRVLYIQGELRREQRFVREALAASPDIDVELRTVHTRDRNNWPVQGWSDLFKPGTFDVYILGDVDSSAFSEEDLTRLRDAVQKHNAGLIMLGGWHSFWPGGYHETPLRDILPLGIDRELDRRGRQKFEDFIAPDLHIEGPVQMLPTKLLGQRSYVMQIGPGADTLATWQELPPLSGANRFRDVRDDAIVLAETADGDPLLVAAEPGGRVLALATDSTWRWVMRGYEKQHSRFWRQVILWLARHDDIVKGSVQVRLDGRRFTPGSPVTFKTIAYGSDGAPVTDALWQAVVKLPDGTSQPLQLTRQDGIAGGQFLQANQAGEYRIAVKATKDGQALGKASSQFLVYKKDFELSGATADPALLASLADKTKEVGGRITVPEELPGIIEELAKSAEKYESSVPTVVTYWDRPWFFGLIVLLLSAEWFLRKRWRLA